MKICKKAILLLSAGIDSTTVLYKLVRQGYDVRCLIFDYGQSLIKEVEIAKQNCLELGQQAIVLKTDLSFLDSSCSIISGENIKKDRTAEEINSGTPNTYVPFRNGIFFSYAVAYGEEHNITEIYGGCNGLNSGVYWDDTTYFAKSFTLASDIGTSPGYIPKILTPFSDIKKSEIVKLGLELGLDYDKTWSCYENGDQHCLKCDSCYQRKTALEANGKEI